MSLLCARACCGSVCIVVTSASTESSSADSRAVLSALWEAKTTVLAHAQQESISVAGQLACSAGLASSLPLSGAHDFAGQALPPLHFCTDAKRS